MITNKDDTTLLKVALSKGFVLEDELRECRYIRNQNPASSVVSILKNKGYLTDKSYMALVKIQADLELRRAVKEHVSSSTQTQALCAILFLFAMSSIERWEIWRD